LALKPDSPLNRDWRSRARDLAAPKTV